MRKAKHVFSINYLLYICNSFLNYPKIIKRNNIKIIVDNKMLPKANRKLLFFKSNEYEDSEISLINRATIFKTDNILELGSCIGITSIHLKNNLGSGKLFCIEPNPMAYKCLVKNLEMNNIVATTYNAVGSNNEEYVDFEINTENFLSIGENKILKKKIKSININNLIKENNINTLIIDIEGFEMKIYDKIFLNKIKTIIIELHPNIYSKKELDKIILYFKKFFNLKHQIKSVYMFKKK